MAIEKDADGVDRYVVVGVEAFQDNWWHAAQVWSAANAEVAQRGKQPFKSSRSDTVQRWRLAATAGGWLE